MKKILTTAALALAAASALAGPPLDPQRVANMKAQARQVMDAGTCAVTNDTRDYGPATVTVRDLSTGAFLRINKNVYNALRNVGYERNPATREWRMVEQIDACLADGDGDACRTYRSLWSQQPPDVRPPGNLALRPIASPERGAVAR